MKFENIPKLIQGGSYEVDFTFPELINRINEYKNNKDEFEKTLDLNPDFQRGHGATCF